MSPPPCLAPNFKTPEEGVLPGPLLPPSPPSTSPLRPSPVLAGSWGLPRTWPLLSLPLWLWFPLLTARQGASNGSEERPPAASCAGVLAGCAQAAGGCLLGRGQGEGKEPSRAVRGPATGWPNFGPTVTLMSLVFQIVIPGWGWEEGSRFSLRFRGNFCCPGLMQGATWPSPAQARTVGAGPQGSGAWDLASPGCVLGIRTPHSPQLPGAGGRNLPPPCPRHPPGVGVGWKEPLPCKSSGEGAVCTQFCKIHSRYAD